VANREVIASSYTLHKWTHKVWRDNHIQSSKNSRKHNELHTGKARINTGSYEDEGEPIQHVAGEEHALPLCETRNKQVNRKGKYHDDTNLRAIFSADIHRCRRNSLRHDRIECSRNAID
jgi:hypothetical protein